MSLRLNPLSESSGSTNECCMSCKYCSTGSSHSRTRSLKAGWFWRALHQNPVSAGVPVFSPAPSSTQSIFLRSSRRGCCLAVYSTTNCWIFFSISFSSFKYLSSVSLSLFTISGSSFTSFTSLAAFFLSLATRFSSSACAFASSLSRSSWSIRSCSSCIFFSSFICFFVFFSSHWDASWFDRSSIMFATAIWICVSSWWHRRTRLAMSALEKAKNSSTSLNCLMCPSVLGEYFSPLPPLSAPTISRTRNCCVTLASVAFGTASGDFALLSDEEPFCWAAEGCAFFFGGFFLRRHGNKGAANC
mmetsp:Transcript_182432/g.578131  ORF Transcript_182432/g.578131 Transcript_182432/m.578131 type:complete len:302 (+) Transcript_182432:572-1477(+)